jgi:hypothetical protein
MICIFSSETYTKHTVEGLMQSFLKGQATNDKSAIEPVVGARFEPEFNEIRDLRR